LILRPVAEDDREALHAIFTQPGVRRFIFDDQAVPREQTDDIVRRSLALFAGRRFGLWLARRPAGALIGFGAFWYFREPPELELLYGVADEHVGAGFGREIAQAITDYGFTALEMTTIRASTDYAHARSRRLLETLGFEFERRAVIDGLDTVFYTATRDSIAAHAP
jgi:RimJ/RimL family protein N-acetyltransferase